VVKEIEAAGSKAIAIQAYRSDVKQIANLFWKAIEHFGKLDIVISNAGIESFGNIGEVTPEEFDRVFGPNTRGQFFVAQQAYKHTSQGGRLILTSSISASLRGVPGHAVYSGSKAAVEAFARCLPEDFGPKKVTVNIIAAGGVKSDMAAANGIHYIPAADPSWSMEQIAKVVAGACPLKRMAEPVDVARVVAFLVSDEGE
jgi:NAD(P)-dependent dehydrogenase (short-subunit alcohol dehydrogenase family)